MRESTIESYLVAQVEKRGGRAPKWVSPGLKAVMDRLVFLPGGWLALAETKSGPARQLDPLQGWLAGEFRKLGFRVVKIDSHTDVDALMMEYELWKRAQV
ncbi:MAG TPA: hypothetical protein VFM48_04960 [Aquabacterium sp.]|nr:hypothetical protein [Aquabacterium sp.]